MKFVADLHLHSKYSRAVSAQMTLVNMANWAKLKGIDVLATGDFTHPFWFDQLKNELEDAGNGLYKLRVNGSQFTEKNSEPLTVNREPIYFLLSCEVSSIYSQGGKTRRIHTLFMFPTLDSVEKFNKELLRRRANLRSDGRPIVGINSRDLAAIALECSEKALVIPAHVWTPWFSVFGSFSGFDSIEECFGDMAKFIYGIETGLSSDPEMNWQVGDLDNRAILSFSDAHSLEKMGREATVFEGESISYQSIFNAIRGTKVASSFAEALEDKKESKESNVKKTTLDSSDSSRIAFTIEFYPEEGKYHFTGHRNCNYSQSPQDSWEKGDVCPVCGRKLTVGVMHRVGELKTQEAGLKTQEIAGLKWKRSQDDRPPYLSLVPLMEIIADALNVGVGSQKVKDYYLSLVNALGSEFGVMIKASIADIAKFSGGKIAESVAKVRKGDIVVEPGYDGKFGVVKIWDEKKEFIEAVEPQLNLFN